MGFFPERTRIRWPRDEQVLHESLTFSSSFGGPPGDVGMNRIQAKEKSIAQLLQNRRFSIDDYQREYKWTTKHVEELLLDLSTRFLEEWEAKHDRAAVAQYGGYFLGSIVVSEPGGGTVSLIVDGQQRMTTLTLLLM